MRIKVITSILFSLILSYQKEIPYSRVKKNLLYSDIKANIYLKSKIDIASEKDPQNDKIVYLDDVLYKDKVLKLNQFVDTATLVVYQS